MTRRREFGGVFEVLEALELTKLSSKDFLGMNSTLRAITESTQSMSELYGGFGGMNSTLRAITENTRSMNALYDSFGGMNSTLRAITESTRSMSELYGGLGGMSSTLRAITESTRSITALHDSFGGMSSTFRAITESTRSITALYDRLGEVSSAVSAITESASFRLSEFGAQVAIAGLTGNFDQGLTRAAVAAAFLVEASADAPEALEEARVQSALLDAIADIESIVRKMAGGTREDVSHWVEVLLDKVLSGYEERRKSARLPQVRLSLDNIIKLVIVVVYVVGLHHSRQGFYLAEQYLRPSEQPSHDDAQDKAVSHAADPVSDQVPEFRHKRGASERHVEDEENMELDAAAHYQYIVERHTRLLVAPSPKAPKIVDLYRNQSVVLLQRKHKWILVRYYDYLSGKLVEGWVMKKHLRRLPVQNKD